MTTTTPSQPFLKVADVTAGSYQRDAYRAADSIRAESGFLRNQFDMFAGPLLIAPVRMDGDTLAVRIFPDAHKTNRTAGSQLRDELRAKRLPFDEMDDGSIAIEITRERLRSELVGLRTESTPVEYLLHSLGRHTLEISDIMRLATLGKHPVPGVQTPISP